MGQTSKHEPLYLFYLWTEFNAVTLKAELNLHDVKSIGQESFFVKLITQRNFKGVDVSSAKQLSNAYMGKLVSVSVNVLSKFAMINKLLQINKHKFYDALKDIASYSKYRERVRVRNSKQLIHLEKKSLHSRIVPLKGSNTIYGLALNLIKNHCQSSIKALINGGLVGKAPAGWFEEIAKFIKKRSGEGAESVDFELMILCSPSEKDSPQIYEMLHEIETKLNLLGIRDRFIRRIICQEEYWIGPDFLVIDNEYLIINWIDKLDRDKKNHRTNRGVLISYPRDVIQWYKDFFDKVVWNKGLGYYEVFPGLKKI